MRHLLLSVLAAAIAAAAPCTVAGPKCIERLPLAGTHYLNVYRSHPLTQRNPAIERAFILVHGTQRDGDLYFTTATVATSDSSAAKDTLVVAPQFHGQAPRCMDKVEPGELTFTCNGWKDGEAALEAGTNSYAAMDVLLKLIDDRDVFPNLKEIVLAGHSAGGQYVQRYAAMNRAEAGLHVPLRYIAANPSSYLYLDSWRPVPDVTAACPGFDNYKYGLKKLDGYAAEVGAETIVREYPKRNVTYLLGERDVKDEHNMDSTCPAMAQGENRFVRGQAYAKHLSETTGAKHAVVTVPGCDHNASCMYRSTVARRIVFGK